MQDTALNQVGDAAQAARDAIANALATGRADTLMQELQNRSPEASQRGDELFASLREDGALREDVDPETVIAFVNIVANGLALAVSLGLQFDVDALLKLLHRGIDPLPE